MRKEEVERSKEGRRGRRVTSLPEWSLWGSKCTPKGPKKEAKRLPNLCLEASGRPLASLGALGGAEADFLAILDDFSPNQGPKRALEAHFEAFSTPEGVQKGPQTP